MRTGRQADMSFLEMLDVLNEKLITQGEEPIAFDSDCREGICSTCGMMINGVAHGPRRGTTVCQLHLRWFKDGDVLWLEPWRDRAFPVVKDPVVNRGSLDRIIEAGGFISVRTGSAPRRTAFRSRKANADHAMDAAACIGCGACVAACPNGSAALALITGANLPSCPHASGSAGTISAGSDHGRTTKALATALCTGNAKPFAQSRLAFSSLCR